MSQPHIVLGNWFATGDMSQNKFAQMIGVHRSSITLYLQQRRRPCLATATAIEQATGGQVTASMWGHAA